MVSVRFSPEDALDRHADDRRFIEVTLAEPIVDQTVVVTHHARIRAQWRRGSQTTR